MINLTNRLLIPFVGTGRKPVIRDSLYALNYCYHCKKRQFCNYTDTSIREKKSWRVVRPGRVSPLRCVPDTISHPPYVPTKTQNPFCWNTASAYTPPHTPEVKSAQQINGMRESCAIARDILFEAGTFIKPGVTTDFIDQIVHNACIQAGGYPSPLQYKSYPKSVCTSVNNVACHGIPDDQPLCSGDIINVDVTIFYRGYHGDTSTTFLVGDVDSAGKRLVDVTRQCRDLAISVCGPGVPFKKIGQIVQELAEDHNYKVIPFFCGHGIGEYFHGPPNIIHVANEEPGAMKTGMTFTIEPILSEGGDDICLHEDGWTALSTDDSRSAQCEHTILITDHGVDVLTV